jgi:hypothetical protein
MTQTEEDIVGICYQATPSEAIAGSGHAIVVCEVCELAVALQLHVLMIYDSTVNPVTNGNPHI